MRATALVSELFLQKLRHITAPLAKREHFFSIAAHAMRQVLIEDARRRSALRRVAAHAVTDLLALSGEDTLAAEDRFAVRQVFQALAKMVRAAAESMRLRFLEGLTISQTAERMGKPAWKVRNDCDFGLDWMGGRSGSRLTCFERELGRNAPNSEGAARGWLIG